MKRWFARLMSLLLSVFLSVSVVLPCLSVRADAVAGVDDLAVSAFVVAVSGSLGYKWTVTDTNAFGDYLITTWNHAVELGGRGITALKAAYDEWVAGREAKLNAAALDALNSMCAEVQTNETGITTDSSLSSNSHYICTYNGLPVFNDKYPGNYNLCPLLSDMYPSLLTSTTYDVTLGVTTVFGVSVYWSRNTYVKSGYDYVLLSDTDPPGSGNVFPIDGTRLYVAVTSSGQYYFCVYRIHDTVRCELFGPTTPIDDGSLALLAEMYNGTFVADSAAIDIPSGVLTGSDLAGEDADSDDDDLVYVPSIPKIGTGTGEHTGSEIIQGVADGSIAVSGTTEKAGESTGEETGDEPDTSGIKSIGTALTMVFPFCIPFDIYHFCAALNATAEAPQFDITIPETQWTQSYTFHLDFSQFNGIASLFRKSLLLLFCIGLASATGKFIKW